MNGQGQEHIRLDASAFTAKNAIVFDIEAMLGAPMSDATRLYYVLSGSGYWIFFADITEEEWKLEGIHGGANENDCHVNNLAGARFYATATSPSAPLRIPAGQYKKIIVLSQTGAAVDGFTGDLFIEREHSSAKRGQTTTTPLPERAVASGTIDVDSDPANSEITINDAGGPIDFGALGVQPGDTLRLIGRNVNFIAQITAVSGVTLTFDNTVDQVTQDDADPGTAYTIANQANFGIDADNWLGAAIFIHEA